LLSDNPESILRGLISGAGEGLEYDLNDVVVLRFIHQSSRHLLVPLHLELPLVRQQSHATRIAESSIAMLPENVRDTEWALRGCQAHSACFDRFEAYLDDQLRGWAAAFTSAARNVFAFLRRPASEARAITMIEPVYRAVARRLGSADVASHDLEARLKERGRRPGVNIFGYFASDIGVGESTRGWRVPSRCCGRSTMCHSAPPRYAKEPGCRIQRFDYLSDTNVFVSFPHQQENLLGMLRPEQLLGRRNVTHLAWEQKDANPLWKVVYDRYDEIWTIAGFAATPFRKMFPGRIRVVPNVLDFAQFPCCEESGRTRLRGEMLKFLFVFNANSSVERKNPEGAIDAFIAAFKDTCHAARARLTLKVSSMSRPEHAARVRRLMRKASASGLDINFDGRELTRAALLRLIAESDCYVSLHRAEGFGYTMAEAMFYGLPVIASGYSGNLEFMTPESSLLVPCVEAFVKSAEGPFQRGSIWGEPDTDAAAMLMRQVADNPSASLEIGERGRKTVMAKLSAAAVAESVKPFFVPGSQESQTTPRLTAD
jgi:glycosyltransferase involved in cell wall biosynthesis